MIDIESVLTIVNFSPAYILGCVGIRCVFCKDLPDEKKAGQHGECCVFYMMYKFICT